MLIICMGFPEVAQMVRNPPAMWETWVQSLGWEDPLEEGMVINSSILAWRIPIRQRSLVGYSPQSHKELDTTEAAKHASTGVYVNHKLLIYPPSTFSLW